ncbi:MucBP domain-containing protein [Carnobacteriaceae bacterium zg-C25]|nr:MucBP domain-containing protein [Carnobacteriaceae bacterium zg-C25]
MKYVINKLGKMIAVFILLASQLLSFGGGYTQAFAEDNTTSVVTTSVTYVDKSVTGTKSGENTSFYLNVAVSGSNTNYQQPYVDVEFSKSLFEKPNNPSTAASLEKYELVETADKYIMRFTYKSLAGGTNVSIPFQLKLKPHQLMNNEKFDIKQTFFTNDDVEVYNNTNQFVVETNKPTIGRIANYVHTIPGPEPVPATVANDHIVTIPGPGLLPPQVQYAGYGRDSRPVEVSIVTPDNFMFDQALNADWTYDATTKTLKRVIIPNETKTSGTYDFNFAFKLQNQPFDVPVPFTYSIAYKNNDGTTEPIESNRVQNVTFNYYPYQEGTMGIVKTGTPYQRFYSETDFNSEYAWTLGIDFGDATKYVQIGDKVGFDKITDTPSNNVGLKFNEVAIYTPAALPNGIYDADNLAKLSRNRVVGTLPDDSTEEIARNVPLSTSANKQFVNLNGKVFKKVEFIFDEPVLVTKLDDKIHRVIVVEYRTTLDQPTIAKIDTWAKDLKNYRQTYSIPNRASVSYKTHTSPEALSSTTVRPSLAFVFGSYTYLTTPNGGTLVYPDQVIQYRNRLNIEQRSRADKEFKDGKVIILAPPGLIWNGVTRVRDEDPSEGTFKLSDTYETVYNYKDTGKTAYIYDIVESTIYGNKTDDSLLDDYKEIIGSFTTTRELPENTTLTIETLYSFSNNKVFNNDLIVGNKPDRLDVDEDGDTAENLTDSSAPFIFTPPKELIVSKKSKNDGEEDGKYFSSTTTDGLDVLNYRVDIFNNTDNPIGNATVIDVLPHLNDLVIVPNKEGVYAERGTEYRSTLVGPVTAPEGYTVYYTSDAPKGTLAGNVALNWVLANAVTDFSKVTALKFVMNPGKEIAPKMTDHVYFSVKNPSTTTVDGNRVSNNTVAYYFGNNVDGAVESFKNTAVLTEYVVKGKAYYDRNDDSTFNEGDVVIANREVVLYKVENDVETEVSRTTTNDAGDYTFTNIIEKRGDYRVKITKNPNDLLTTPLASTATDVNNDLTADDYAAVTLDAQKQRGVLNLALKNIFGTVNTYHQSETGETLSPSTTQVGVVNTTYNTQPATIENYTFKEVSTTLGSAATGNFIDGTVNVYYIYQRSNAGKVTVTHKDETGATVSPQVELNGTNKLGLPYTTNFVTVENFTLITTPENATGTFTTVDQTVNYVYRRNDAGKVTVTHKDETGAVLAQPVELNGTQKLGLPYTTNAVTVENHTLITTPTNATGTFTTGEQTVNYVYRRNDAGKVTVTHKDETGAVLAQPVELNGTQKLGLPYTTNAVTVENHTLITTPTNATGTFTTGEQTVNYVYRRNDAGKVTVTHKDETGAVLAQPVELNGTQKLGLPYTTNAATIDNYELVTTPTNATGTFATGEQTVEYVYRRKNAGKVVVTHKDETGAVLAQQVELDGTQKLGLPYTTNAVTVENHTLIATPTNATGTFTTGEQTVEYVYRRNDAGKVVVTHKDETGAVLAQQVELDGTQKLGLPYTTNAATVENHTLIATPTNATGAFTTGEQTVEYVYRRNDAGKVVVTFKDENGEVLAEQVELDGTQKLGLPYETTSATVENYELVVTPENATGTFTTEEQTVEYVYRRKNAEKVVVTFKDENGEVLAEQVELDGTQKLGLPYETTSATVENYELVVTPENATGTFTTEEQTVEYVYRRKNAEKVVVTFKDENGNALLPPVELDGTQKLGLPYETTSATVENYELVVTPENATGTFTTEEQTVEYVYRRKNAEKVVVTFKDEKGNVLAPSVELDGTQKLGLPYETTSATVENYELVALPANATGTFTTEEQTVEYVYRRKNAEKVVVTFKDENGNVLAPSVELDGTNQLGLPYETTSATVENYELVALPTNATGTFTTDKQTVEYVYRRKDAGKVVVTYTDENGKVLAQQVELDGKNKLGLPYDTENKVIEGYVLIAVPANKAGIFGTDAQEVRYVYRALPKPQLPKTGQQSDFVGLGGILLAVAYMLKRQRKQHVK